MKLNKFIIALCFVFLTASTTLVANNNTPSSQEDKASDKKTSYEEYKKQTKSKFKQNRDKAITQYLEYRDSILGEFVKQMRRPWKEEQSKPAEPKPEDNSIEPEIITEDEIAQESPILDEQNAATNKNVKPEKEITEAPVKKDDVEPKKETTEAPVKKDNVEPKKEVTEAPVKKDNVEPKKEIAETPVKKDNVEPKKEIAETPVKKDNVEHKKEVTEAPVKKDNVEPKKEVTEAPVKKDNVEPKKEIAETPVKKDNVKPKKEVTETPVKKDNVEPKKEIAETPVKKDNVEPKKEVTEAPVKKDNVEPKKEITEALVKKDNVEPKKEKAKNKEKKAKSKKKGGNKSSISLPKVSPKNLVAATPIAIPNVAPKKEVALPKAEPKKDSTTVVAEQPQKEIKKDVPKAKALSGGEPQQIKVNSIVSLPNLAIAVQPVPFVPVIKQENKKPNEFNFTFYGTTLTARIDERCKFKIESINNNGIANAMEKISKNSYLTTTLSDCLNLRTEYYLCDWAYLQMLQKLSDSFFGGKCNESTLLTGYLYSMSGYKMRFAYNGNKELVLLFASDQFITDLPFISLASDKYRNYYTFNNKTNSQLYICDFAFPQEKAMSLYIKDTPVFEKDNQSFDLTLHTYKHEINYEVNKNLIDFYDSYPTPMTENDTFSKWSYYALTPLSDEAKASAYPSIQKHIEGKSDLAAVNIIMDWIETYKYGYDSKIWGYDRAFFPDETLFYPASDCEDHAILLSRMVNDLLNLETALIYYPGHLAAAVRFHDDVTGDYVLNNGVKYTVCDPTIYYAKAGTTMRSCKGKQATLILLNNNK